jgi:hypothetical protein
MYKESLYIRAHYEHNLLITGSVIVLNIRNDSPNHATSHTRTLEFSAALLSVAKVLPTSDLFAYEETYDFEKLKKHPLS